MDLSLSVIAFLSGVSFVAGFVDSIAGGGGLITIPSLLLAGIPSQFALGSNKFSSCLGTAIAVWNFARKNLIIWPLVAIGIGFTFVGGVIGSRAILAFDESAAQVIILSLLPFAALTLFWRRNKSSSSESLDLSLKAVAIPTTLLCLGIGFYDGFFGPGTGTFLALGFFTFIRVDLLRSTALAKVFNFISNLGALAVFLFNQKVLFALAIPMAIANMCGNYVGSHLAIKKGENLIRVVILLVLALLLLTLIIKISNPTAF